MSNEDKCECEIEQKPTKSTPKDIMKQSIYDKKVELPQVDKVDKLDKVDKVRAQVAKCSNIQPFKLEDMDIEKVLVEYRIRKPKADATEKSAKNDTKKVEKENKSASKMSDCDAFRLAGFQHDWTKEKVEGMLKSDDGRALLERVDREFKRLTGKKTISESDILKCYPNYLKKSKNIQLSIKIDE